MVEKVDDLGSSTQVMKMSFILSPGLRVYNDKNRNTTWDYI